MDITVGNYTIHSDAVKNLWITEHVERQDEETGKLIVTDNRVAGYVSTFEDLYKDFIRRNMYDSNADSLFTAIDVLVKAQAQVSLFVEKLGEKSDG